VVQKTLKKVAQHLFLQTLNGIQIPTVLARKLNREGSTIQAAGTPIDLKDFREIVAISFGKASYAMAEALSDILAPEFQVEGILVGPSSPLHALPGWKTFVGGHPLPTQESFAAGRAILDRLARCGERSLVFFLISGGGSAMVEQPLHSGVTLEDFQKLHFALVTCGAPIEEINVIRKHLSATKGGRLAAAAPHAMKITFAISDVPEGQESALASGPTLPDPTTAQDAEQVVRAYDLLPKLPPSICALLERRALNETPKPGEPAFARSHFELLLRTHDLTHACHHACEGEGFVCLADNSSDNWPIEKAADYLLEQLEALKKDNPGRSVALMAGGEVSSPVTGEGIGGRNLAFVLACVPKIAGKKITVLSGGTDGIDGNSPAAGAVADGETLQRARAAGLEPGEFLRRSDSYSFFKLLDDVIITGPTGNNLRDLRILLAY
jgi:hydroxypyruvate reductase